MTDSDFLIGYSPEGTPEGKSLPSFRLTKIGRMQYYEVELLSRQARQFSRPLQSSFLKG